MIKNKNSGPAKGEAEAAPEAFLNGLNVSDAYSSTYTCEKANRNSSQLVNETKSRFDVR
jgi:hypothetical protein